MDNDDNCISHKLLKLYLSDQFINPPGSFQGNVDVATSTSSSWSTSFSSRKELYALSAVVEHYGVCGGGHYAAYRKVASNPDTNDQVRPRGKHWVYISDDHVSQVSEVDVLAAEATLLFYERL
jgi:ubiquitin carboxyl-terminal hydrolase 30